MNRVEILDQVGDLSTIPKTKYSTTKQIAEFYGVESAWAHITIARYRDEIHSSDVRKLKYNELKGRLFEVAGSTQAWKEMRYSLGIASGVTNLYSKQTVLLIGFMLEDSEVADRVRNLVMNDSGNDDIFEPIATTPVTIIENTSLGTIAIPNSTMPSIVVEPTVQKKRNDMQSDELIKTEVNETNEIIVSGRDLHEFLEVKTLYKDWFKRMITYGFIENQDYVAIAQKRATAQGNETTYIDHALKLDMAKEISMIQRNEKGKQARQYFIETEKKYKSQAVVPVASYMIDNPIERAKHWIEEQQEKMLLETKVQEQVVVIEEQAHRAI